MKIGIGYIVFMLVMVVFTAPIVIAPFIAESNPGLFIIIHTAYSPSCHQILSRSFCYFPEQGTIEDCIPEGIKVPRTRDKTVEDERGIGYKFPVCARDVPIYLTSILGGMVVFLLRKGDSKEIPPLWLYILALIPIGLDGGTQLIGLRESTNLIRIVTGIIAGLATAWFAIPLMNRAFSKKKEKKKKKTKKE